MRLILGFLLLVGCCKCPEADYTGWKRVQNPFYVDSRADTIWIRVDSTDVWIGKWDSTWYMVRGKVLLEGQ